jgi:hypothetical protein
METSGAACSIITKLETHLEYWLRRVLNAVSGDFARSLQVGQNICFHACT